MINVHVFGGLGNQLFQYAAGYALSQTKGTDLLLDIHEFSHNNPRKFRLNQLQIPIKTLSPAETLISRIVRKLFYQLHLNTQKYQFSVFNTISVLFDYGKSSVNQNFFNAPGHVFLSGYWQSEKYFNNHRPQLIDLIKPNERILETIHKGKELKQITSTNSIGLHIRRGDYVNDPIINQYHGICSIEYYKTAVNYLSEYIKDPYFYIFSDDHEWGEENFKWLNKPYVFLKNKTEDSDIFDLWLMSQCKHQIIANSSFSWWGAWLNQNPEKIVIAPERWFKVSDRNSIDLIPGSWKTLPNQ